ncbi:MAG: tRNA-dihydrouridine synthase B [Luteibaculaceae bacterium]|jgi:tRNA-dihydrouridine synthase B
MQPILLSSPLQGFTDFRFRNAIEKYFGGINWYYAPYIRLNGKMEIKPQYQRDLDPKNNIGPVVIPQVMTNDPDEFLFVVKYIQSLGYKELNWNLGCPYPMVTKRCMGSGLINDPEKIRRVLDKVHSETDCIVSMKMRLGYESPQEILDAMPVLNQFPLKNIAIHARLGKQLYKGGVDWDGFGKCLDATDHTIYYNGDITTVHSFQEVKTRFPSLNHWMIGRGLIADPFLPQMIKDGTTEYPADRFERFRAFHNQLLEEYQQSLSGEAHVILKMASFWEYFQSPFLDTHKTLKKVVKAKKLDVYGDAVDAFLANEIDHLSNM